MPKTGLRILARGTCKPQSDWLNDGLVVLGHDVVKDVGSGVDVVLVHDPGAVGDNEVREWRRSGACTMLRAWSDPATFESWRHVAGLYDFVLTTGLAELVNLYKDAGARALPLLPSAPPRNGAPSNSSRDIDIVFAGRLDGAERRYRREFLKRAASRWRVAVATDEPGDWPDAFPRRPDLLEALHQRALLTFHMDAIALNRFGITRRCPATRAFYGPSQGSVLLAELKPWLTHCYDPADEMAGFADIGHALEIAEDLISHRERCEDIARRATQRLEREHMPENRAGQVALLATGQIPIEMSILEFGPWYQQIELPGGSKTSLLGHSNTQRWARLQSFFPDVQGRRVLDLGMNAGYFSLQCLKLGASRVVGIDASPLACAQARFIKQVFNATNLHIVQGDLTQAVDEKFDLCLMLAILHHLADINPVLATVTSRASTAILEWEVRKEPYFHPIEEVMASLESFGWTGEVMDRGHRPIILGKKSKP